MRWEKLGVVWAPDGSRPWARSHATCPTPVRLDEARIRVFIQCRDDDGVGRVGYVDVSVEDPLSVLGVSESPVLDIGRPGTFDDNGVLQTCVIEAPDGSLYMYYVGFELSRHIRYRLLTGLAVSTDGGNRFSRLRQTPILERSDAELYFRGGPFVLQEGGRFRMWYAAGSGWIDLDGKPMPVYDLRYIESENGIDWPAEGTVSLELQDPDEHGFGRPYVLHEEGRYKLFFSVRKRSLGRYRLAYAESADGLHWERMDSHLNLDVSPRGWDSEAVEYSAVVHAAGQTYLFYNGNDLGGTGFGVARLVERS